MRAGWELDQAEETQNEAKRTRVSLDGGIDMGNEELQICAAPAGEGS